VTAVIATVVGAAAAGDRTDRAVVAADVRLAAVAVAAAAAVQADACS
jgi:hypothetical protein